MSWRDVQNYQGSRISSIVYISLHWSWNHFRGLTYYFWGLTFTCLSLGWKVIWNIFVSLYKYFWDLLCGSFSRTWKWSISYLRNQPSQTLHNHSLIPNQQNEEQNQGLPNVGNTCYLNSILQILYAAQEMRESVISRSKANPSLPFHKLIANVFEDVAGKAKEETKRKHLRALLSFLSESSPQIAKFEQNDAYECLLAILNLLQGQDPRHSKLAFFKVSYEARCDCSGESSYFEEYFLTLGQRCVACKQPFRTDIVDSGRYLIALPQQSFDLRIDFGSKGKSGVSYDVRAFVIYFGNKQSGHYISKRKESGDWLNISDINVTYEANPEITNNPKIALYLKKIQQEET